MKLTRLGKNLLAKCVAEGFELRFTRFAIGSGNLDENESIHELTDLKRWKMDLPIVDSKVVGDGTAEITAYLSNAQVVKSFRCKEHGLFARDENGDEVLYSYRNLGDEYDTIPANVGNVLKNVFLVDATEISDAENVTAELDMSVAYINTADFKDHINSAAPHPNTPTRLSDVEIATEIWATDHDNHLHKISIDNLKKILREELPAVEANPAADLGLNANILYVEDFQTADASDYFKLKVTSCAEHGSLIGVLDISAVKTGAQYVLCDGTFAEQVVIQSVLKNDSGYYLKLKNPLANSYSGDIYLYRTTPAPCQLNTFKHVPPTFSGIPANIQRTIFLTFDPADIQGDGILDDGFFTLI